MYTVKYSDGTTMESEEHEVRRWLKIHDTREWLQYCGFASGAFTYLKNRVTNNCPAAFHYKDIYNMWKLARVFNPALLRTPGSTSHPATLMGSMTSHPCATMTSWRA